MKILLISPPIEILKEKGEFISIIAPLGLAYLAAVLEKEGHEVKILDCLALSARNPTKIKRGKHIFIRYSPPNSFIKKYIKDFQPSLVGISNLISPTEQETIKLAKTIKKIFPNTLTVLGGSNATSRAGFFIKIPEIDFVVSGEGEETLSELIKQIPNKKYNNIKGLTYKDSRGKVSFNPPRPFIQDLDKLPFPAWHLLPMEEYLNHQPAGIFVKRKRTITMITSRGCPNACLFCTNESMWGRVWRKRSVENVMKEIHILINTYKAQEIQFIDNNISVLKDRFINLCHALKKEKITWIPSGGIAVLTIDPNVIKLMAESGCYAIQLGIEHGDLDMQKRIGKIVPLEATKKLVRACHKYGIWTHGNFVLGLPGETVDSAQKSLEYAINADVDSVSFFTALPTPGSRLFDQLDFKKIDLKGLRFYISDAQCSDLPPAVLKNMIKDFFRKFLVFKIKRELNPINLFTRISQLRSFDDIRFYFIMLKRFTEIEKVD